MAALLVIIASNSALGQGLNFKIDGNDNLSNSTYLGSTNAAPLIFGTNGIERGSFSATGTFTLNSLTGTGAGLVQTDVNGLLTRFNLSGNVNEVLYGNGVWGPIPLQSHWTQIGNDIFYNHGNVGIGTNTPSSLYKLDVIGDVRISNNLYVGGGIVITEKVQANVRVNTASLEADSILMDSTKAFYGLSTFAGDVRLQNKLDVTGNAIVAGDFKTTGFTKLSGNVQIDSLAGLGYKFDSLTAKSYKMLFADESGNIVSKTPGNCEPTTIPWMLGGKFFVIICAQFYRHM